MTRHLKSGLSFAAHGVLIGMALSIFFSYLSGTGNYYPSSSLFMVQFATPLDALVVSIVLWALMGILFGFGAMIFEIKKWSTLKQTVVNFLVYYLIFSPLAILAGWFSLTLMNFLAFTVIFVVVYAICWLVTWFFGSNRSSQRVAED